MKIVTSETMSSIDRRAIDGGIPGLVLMENAGKGAAAAILRRFGAPRRVLILCGRGNNGGDGHVVARLLQEAGCGVRVVLLAERAAVQGDARHNLDLLDPALVRELHGEEEIDLLRRECAEADLIVDALFGTGLSREPDGLHRLAIGEINAAAARVVSLDIPSGVDGSTGRIPGCAVQADVTVTFACAKVGHMLYPGAEMAGELEIVDIGIPVPLIGEAPGYEYVDAAAAASLVRRRKRTDHKGTFGHCLIVAGGTGTTGAAAMAANSAVRSGAGLVSLAVPQGVHAILELKTTEAMTIPLADDGHGFLAGAGWTALVSLLEGKTAVAVGPGIGRRPGAVELVHRIVSEVDLPMVLDADALNAVAQDIGVLFGRRAPTVLTPHPGEMSRLTGVSIAGIESDRPAAAASFAAKYGVFVILKGARTIIASPDGRIVVNASGNPGMASGGMGDVLTGMLGALLAQRYTAWDACRLGVYVHGLAGDLVAGDKGEIGMSAVDVQEAIPRAFRKLINRGGTSC